MKKTFLPASAAIFSLSLAQGVIADTSATESAARAYFMVTGGFTYGGDKLATIEYKNGDDVDIRAGGLLLFGVGGLYRFNSHWETQFSINYQFDRANARNGDATFDRKPIDLLGFYRMGAHRFGGGITYHLDPTFDSDFDFANGKQKIEFDNALGAVIEYDYFFFNSFSVGARYVNIKYKASTVSGDIDGSYGGILLNGYF